MLDPRGRRLLLEALRPPEGYTLDRAIGTTYSLDLLAALITPMAFTLFDWAGQDGRPVTEPLAILEALRRHANRLSLFCHVGGISIPKQHEVLFSYLEGSIVEVAPRHPQGVFHPKVWVLRFATKDEPVLYRTLVLSRNLTFDRSWDTMLVLNGELVNRRNAFAENHPLGDFVAALPGLAVRRAAPERVRVDIERVQTELRRVRFDLPDGFDALTFCPLGIDGAQRWPFKGRIDRVLVVSPFLSAGFLKRITEEGEKHILVSRLESLESLDDPSVLAQFERVYFMNPSADPPDEAVEAGTSGHLSPPGFSLISGLHAKIYVADGGRYSSVWVGSANATAHAFGANVEFMVELEGTRGRCGVEVLLGKENDSVTLASLLQPFEPGAKSNLDNALKELEQGLEGVRRAIASTPLVLRVAQGEAPADFHMGLHTVQAAELTLPAGARVSCWPITLREGAASRSVSDGSGLLADFGSVSFEAITSFVAFEAAVDRNGTTGVIRFVSNLPLEGAPADRQDRVLRSLLRDPNRVIRFLLLLLSEGSVESLDLITGDGEEPGSSRSFGGGFGPALFESLVRALDRNPARLDDVARVVEDLRKTPEGCAVLPEGFEKIWEPIWAARQRMRRDHASDTA
jgi:hypothetical protein